MKNVKYILQSNSWIDAAGTGVQQADPDPPGLRLKFEDINGRTPEEMKIIKKYYDNPVGFFLMAGLNGRGKSFVAQVIYDKVDVTSFTLPQFNHDEAWFITQADLNYEWQMKNIEELILTLKNTKLLILDDIGTRRPSDAFLDFLYLIADHRWKYRQKLGTIITTNLNASMMREQFGDAFVSRVASGICMRIEGEDRRFNEF